MVHAADAVAKAEDFSRRIGGVAPDADFREIASADVACLEIAEDGQRRVPRGRIGCLDRRRDRRKGDPFRLVDGTAKAFFSGIDGLTDSDTP